MRSKFYRKFSIVLFILICFLGIEKTKAQDFHFGGKFGLNIANFGGKDAEPDEGVNRQPRVGFAFGGFVRYPLYDFISLQLEALYTQKGAGYIAIFRILTFKLAYLELPLILMLHPTNSVSIYLGPAFGYNLSSIVESRPGNQVRSI